MALKETFGNNMSSDNKGDCYTRNIPSYTLNADRTPSGYIKCADKGGVCQLLYGADILYGANGNYVSGVTQANQKLFCDDTVFNNASLLSNNACYAKPIDNQSNTLSWNSIVSASNSPIQNTSKSSVVTTHAAPPPMNLSYPSVPLHRLSLHFYIHHLHPIRCHLNLLCLFL